MDRNRALHVGGILVLALVLAPFVVHAVPELAGADHSYIVLSGSMAPAINAGDVVIVADVEPSAIEEGDVITFVPPSGHEEAGAERVTHRVVEVVREDGALYFRTKGDANEDPDGTRVPAENVEGRVMLTLPLVGHAISFVGSPVGILLFVVVPAVLLAINEVWTLYRAATGGGSDD